MKKDIFRRGCLSLHLNIAYLCFMRKLYHRLRAQYGWTRFFLNYVHWYKMDGFSLAQLFWGYFHGFRTKEMHYYGLPAKTYKQYLSARQYQMLAPLNKQYDEMIGEKLSFFYLLTGAGYGQYLPDHYFFLDRYGPLPLTPALRAQYGARAAADDVLALLKEKGKLCLKVIRSAIGRGLLIFTYSDGRFFENNQERTERQVRLVLHSLHSYLVQEYVAQHAFLHQVFPGCLNTTKVLALWDSQAHSFYLARATQRFGTDQSFTDHHAMALTVNVATGVLDGKANFDFIHPNSGVNLRNAVIPHWAAIKDKLVEISNALSFCRILSYDIAVTPDSFKIIEINSLPEINTFQWEQPLLTDPRTCRLYEELMKDGRVIQ